jgi:hypothetical protein
MGLDLRWPIGLMFTLLGAMLTITGLVTRSDAEVYQRSLGIDINLWWGLVLLAFGVFMLIMARRASSRPADRQPPSGDKSAGDPPANPPPR